MNELDKGLCETKRNLLSPKFCSYISVMIVTVKTKPTNQRHSREIYGIVARLIGASQLLTKLSSTVTIVHERVVRHSSVLLRLPPRAFPICALLGKTASYLSTPAFRGHTDSAYTVYVASE